MVRLPRRRRPHYVRWQGVNPHATEGFARQQHPSAHLSARPEATQHHCFFPPPGPRSLNTSGNCRPSNCGRLQSTRMSSQPWSSWARLSAFAFTTTNSRAKPSAFSVSRISSASLGSSFRCKTRSGVYVQMLPFNAPPAGPPNRQAAVHSGPPRRFPRP